MKALILITTLVSLGSFTAFAGNNWGHVRLVSTDGTQIQIDYITPSAAGNTIAGANAYFNVTTPAGSDCEAPVRVVIATTCGRYPNGNATIDLIPNGSTDSGACQFTHTQAADLVNATHAGGCNQQISVVVKGNWLTDPANGSHNFNAQFNYIAN